MSRVTVRTAIQSYLNGANLPGLLKVYYGAPTRVDGSDWTFPNDGTRLWAVILFVHIGEKSETRSALPAPNTLTPTGTVGQKAVTYKVQLVGMHKYLPASALANGQDESEWATTLDSFLDSLDVLLRADPLMGTLGANGWLEGAQDEGDLSVLLDLPVMLNDQTEVFSLFNLDFTVREITTA